MVLVRMSDPSLALMRGCGVGAWGPEWRKVRSRAVVRSRALLDDTQEASEGQLASNQSV